MSKEMMTIFVFASLLGSIIFLAMGIVNTFKGNYEIGAVEIGLAVQFFPRFNFDLK